MAFDPTSFCEPPSTVPPTFVGNNSITLNRATMNQIVQFWLAHKWVGETPVVSHVEFRTTVGSDGFLVSLVDPAQEKQ